ncbi:MAG: hypothetical protein MJE68_22185, partial [Proteobacteria bacterium]|nr:hypothetical protein [Pseudomonadota bacterium]
INKYQVASFFFFSSFLAYRDSYCSLVTRFRLGPSTVSGIVRETCEAIWNSLVDEQMPIPSEADWK